MSVTDDTIGELERAIRRLQQYRDVAKESDHYNAGREHGDASRATMDASRMLVRWRQTPAWCYPKRVK